MRFTIPVTAAMMLAALLVGCETAPKGEGAQAALDLDCRATIAHFKLADPSMDENFFKTAHGYAVFPTVGKGGLLVGGAHGRGQLYEKGEVIGYTQLSQGTIGAQIGGQVYSEIIFFENEATLRRFRQGQFVLAAQASAVAATAGASADADYSKGVAVFTMGSSGLMLEASIGGQQFDFEPK